jgi:flagellar motor switch protein FliG
MLEFVAAAAVAAAFAAGRLSASASARDDRARWAVRLAEMSGAASEAAAAVREARCLRAEIDREGRAAAAGRREPWGEIAGADPRALAAYVGTLPKADAVVFFALAAAAQAGAVARELPPGAVADVMTALAAFKGAPVEDVERVEEGLRARFLGPERRMWRLPEPPLRRVAEIVGRLDRAAEAAVMGVVEGKDPALAAAVLRLMFAFEDVARLDPVAVQTLLRHVEKDRLALALKGASDRAKRTFFDNMSERAGKMLREDMEAMGPVRLKDVDQAQCSIVAMAKELAASGQIVIPDGGTEDELVY